MTTPLTSLDDKYLQSGGRVFLSSNQALVRLPLDQARRDRAAGLKTAGFISGYRGSPLHRVVKGFCVQGGDVVAGDGSGGVSAIGDGGAPFADESFVVPHARPGLLSMANMGSPHTNGCQFFFTLAAAPECDGKHVAFGRLLSGLALLRRIEHLTHRHGGAQIVTLKTVLLDAAVLDVQYLAHADRMLVLAHRGADHV